MYRRPPSLRKNREIFLFCMLEKCRKNVEKADVRMFDCKVVISVYKLTAIFYFFYCLFLKVI